MSTELAEKFAAAFHKGIEYEKAALRADSTAYEVALEKPARLTEMTEGDRCFYSFVVPRPSDRLTPGVQCGLIDPSGLEIPVTLVQLDGVQLVVQTEVAFSIAEGAYRLVFVPWFLYDGMQTALGDIPFPESALRAFGKLPAERTAVDSVIIEKDLNATQRRAVQQSVESQLTILWGPPGTGKTTALAELVSNLVRLGRRLLIASTTHAALDQVLSRLARTPALAELIESAKVVRLGYSGQETFGCSLGEVVSRTQSEARGRLDRSQARLEVVRAQQAELQPVLERCAVAAKETQQLDLFAAQAGALGEMELRRVVSSARAAALALLSARAQHAVLALLARRLELVSNGHKRRSRDARLALANGQQQAVTEAKVVLSTLANVYVNPLMKGQEFESVILEEAGMAVLPALYLAAGRARGQVILVGDPQQLPAILATRDPAAQRLLGRNIFDILGERPERIMLDVQYRMHPAIGELVSRLFYGGALLHAPGADTEELAAGSPFPGQAVVVVDCKGNCAVEPGDYSRFNPTSAALAVSLAAEAAARGASVALITPYRKQVRRIQTLLLDRGLSLEQVHCATVHRFQGNERDVVILDLVDGPPMDPGTLLCGRGPGSASANLLNVSLSRARGKLILIADLDYFRARAAGTTLYEVLEASGNVGVSLSR